jgi:ATP-dependent Zn protease
MGVRVRTRADLRTVGSRHVIGGWMSKGEREREKDGSAYMENTRTHRFSLPKLLLALLVLKKTDNKNYDKNSNNKNTFTHRFFSFLRSFLLFLSFFSFLSCERRGAERNGENK